MVQPSLLRPEMLNWREEIKVKKRQRGEVGLVHNENLPETKRLKGKASIFPQDLVSYGHGSGLILVFSSLEEDTEIIVPGKLFSNY